MKKIAFVTSTDDPDLIDDDRLAFEPLAKLGYQISPLVWDNPSRETEAVDAIVFRSCWNYHRKYESFLVWLKALRSRNIPVFNSISVNEWNLNKSYLLELEKSGVDIPKTKYLSHVNRFNEAQSAAFVSSLETSSVVVKPAVSLNGHETYRFSISDLGSITKATLELLELRRDVLIQEYIPEIESSGELSFIFFNGEFSHAIRKTPRDGEFRIHREYGGRQVLFHPTQRQIDDARAILEKTPEALLYCRVDVVIQNNKMILIELEIIDPMLFLGFSPGAPERFARAIHSRIALKIG